MATRFYQLGDYENTIKRKLLENSSQYPDSRAVLANNTVAGTPLRTYAVGDDDATILRKLLENQAVSVS